MHVCAALTAWFWRRLPLVLVLLITFVGCQEVRRIDPAETQEDEVAPGDPDLFRIVPGNASAVLINLDAVNTGDADLFCILSDDFADLTGGGWELGPETVSVKNGWRTDISNNNTVIFIPRRDAASAESLVCAMVTENEDGATYQFHFDLEEPGGELDEEERKILSEIFAACCGSDDEMTACENGPSMGLSFPRAVGSVTNDDLNEGVFVNFCKSVGSECDANGRLRVLNLAGYRLLCRFPGESFASMTELRELDLRNNMFEGDIQGIASSLMGLTNLTRLNLARNDGFEGSLSVEDSEGAVCSLVARNRRLAFLDLSGDNLSGSLPGCLFSGSLEHLELDGNKFSGPLPEDIPEDSVLRTFNAFQSGLTGKLPDSLGNLKLLETFQVFENELTGTLPATLGALPRLRNLIINHNNLTGQIPDSVGESVSLKVARLHHNQFEQLPDAWMRILPANAPEIVVIDASENRLKGGFPLGLARLGRLDIIDLHGNELSGSLPRDLKLFKNATRLIFSNNRFEGTIPQPWRTLGFFSGAAAKNARPMLDLSNNQLSGIIPKFLIPGNPQIPLRAMILLAGNQLICPSDAMLPNIWGVQCSVDSAPSKEPLPGNAPGRLQALPDGDDDDSSQRTAIIAGILVPVAVLGSVAAVVIVWRIRKRKLEKLQYVQEISKDVEFGRSDQQAEKVELER